MIISWNVIGMIKAGKIKEVSSRLLDIKHDIVVLIELRVKRPKANKLREKLKLIGMYLNN